MIMGANVKASPDQLYQLAGDVRDVLSEFQADRVDTDYKVDIVGYNKLNQSHSIAKSERSKVIGFTDAIANAIDTIADQLVEVDKLMIER